MRRWVSFSPVAPLLLLLLGERAGDDDVMQRAIYVVRRRGPEASRLVGGGGTPWRRVCVYVCVGGERTSSLEVKSRGGHRAAVC